MGFVFWERLVGGGGNLCGFWSSRNSYKTLSGPLSVTHELLPVTSLGLLSIDSLRAPVIYVHKIGHIIRALRYLFTNWGP
jgi:hypothetical protein